jgi:hypothetical protein
MKQIINVRQIITLASAAVLVASLLMVCDSHYSMVSKAAAHHSQTAEKDLTTPSCHEVSSGAQQSDASKKSESKSEGSCPKCMTNICQLSFTYVFTSKDQVVEKVETISEGLKNLVTKANPKFFTTSFSEGFGYITLYQGVSLLSIFKNRQSYLMVFRN